MVRTQIHMFVVREYRAPRARGAVRRPLPTLVLVLLMLLTALPATARNLSHESIAQESDLYRKSNLSDLSAYPRPTNDNGWGIHWAPTLLSQSPEDVDRYLHEVDQLNLRWLKLMQPDQANLEHRHLLEQLAARGVEPVLRVHRTYNDPYQHLDALVRSGVEAGVHYYELYSNVNVAGLDGGWREGEPVSPKGLARNWLDAAATVRAAGGYPALPALAPHGAVEDSVFLRRFLATVLAEDSTALVRAWLPLQNYMGNLPLQDTNGFRRFETYNQIVQEMTGQTLPIITTEGGAIPGGQEDPAHPPISQDLIAERTAEAFHFMRTSAPDYYFAFMPWLLVNADAGGYNGTWEAHAWFPAGAEPRPVVQAVKELADPLHPAPPHIQDEHEPDVPAQQPSDLQYAEQAPESDMGQAASNHASPINDGPSSLDTTAVEESASSEAAEDDGNVSSPAVQEPTTDNEQPPNAHQDTAGRVSLTETAITLPTYDYERAFIPTEPGDEIYPSPRLDHEAVGSPSPVDYRAIVVENNFLRLTILPELGGRVYRWEDKLTGRDILYHNSVVKPTKWGVRGWWLGVGGMEWSFPLADHGLFEYQPWHTRIVEDGDNAAAIRLSQDGPDDLQIEITISLNADARYFAVTVDLHNDGSEVLATHFWQNTMLASSTTNRVHPSSQLVWPSDEIKVHGSTGTRSLPMGATLPWPDGSGTDISRLDSWPPGLSFFAHTPPRQGAVGLVDPEGELSVIRSFPHRLVPGLKAFYGPGLDSALWTDDGSGPYFELWTGPGRNFDTPIELAPGQSLRWTEQWYTVPDLGPFVAANAHAALALNEQNGETEIRVASTGSAAMRAGNQRLVVRADGNIVHNEPVSLSIDELYRTVLPIQLEGHHWLIQLIDSQNRVLFAFDNSAETPAVPEAVVASEDAPSSLIEWDERLDELGIDVTRADVKPGQTYWKVIRADFQNPHEGGGRHHIYIEVLDDAGERLVGEDVEIHWPDGRTTVTTEDKPSPGYAANFPMYGDLGGYQVKMPGLSDTVTGMGLPGGRMHVVYNIVFQKAVKR